ncbi:MAG: tetratricopeptide repeat protein [Acidobacteriota bacterium]
MTKKIVVLLVSLILLYSLPVQSQYQGKLKGIVVDDEGDPIPGVDIHIISVKYARRHHDIKSKKDGGFVQVGIYPGRYTIQFQKEGYMPVSTEKKIGIAETVNLKITMHKASQAMQKKLSGANKSFSKGIELFEQEKYEEAIDAYKEAIEENPEEWSYYFNLGLVHKKIEDKEKAFEAFQKAVELNPKSYSANKEMGELLAKAEKWAEAKEYYSKAVSISQDDPDTYYNYGAVLYELGSSEEALEAFLKTIELDEEYADAYYQVGTIYISQNKTTEAIKYLETFLELAPNHPKASSAQQILDYLKK